ncbi:hypothetical protein CC86DRAFT_406689 [Ophiobolus disseminans]|uniref:Uncharacterized protein n=1 Tax=Ophiobolus disseminans TaxID=1469910 RepID=A0A6A7A1J1_9PLEO|nr:hypothetical protein CC86DRAFT_406689 [Ophiobolus disseminans]
MSQPVSAIRPDDNYRAHTLPAAWAPRIPHPDYFATFADLGTHPAIATKHPFRWPMKFAEEMRRLASDSMGQHADAVRLLVGTAKERCVATSSKDAVAEKWRAGVRVVGSGVVLGVEDIVTASLEAGRRLTWEEYGCVGVFEGDEVVEDRRDGGVEEDYDEANVEDSQEPEIPRTYDLPFR